MEPIKSYKFKLSTLEFRVTLEKTGSFDPLDESYAYRARGTHYHAESELIFAKKAPLTVYTESDTNTYENSIVYIPPRFEHVTDNRDNFKLLFTFKRIDNKINAFSAFIEDVFCKKSIVSLSLGKRTEEQIDQIIEHFVSDSEIDGEMTEALLKLLFSDIFLANAPRVKRGTESRKDSSLVKIDNIIREYKRDVNLNDVASELGVCPRQASRIIKKNYGITLSVLMERKRLAVAKDLLSIGEMSISEIVEYVNFSSDSYFYSKFKKLYGVTPAKYRRDKNKKH